MKYYEDDFFYYFWKDHGLASSFGDSKSFLDFLEAILILKNDNDIYNIIYRQNQIFGKEGEFGLVNRLDNDTFGLLYFAKSQEIYQEYKNLQSIGKVNKLYLADVKGDFKKLDTIIAYPIMHHVQINEKMIALKSQKDINKGRGKRHFVQTYVSKLYYDEIKDTSTLLININKGIRHQIRVHLASIGFPIIGDRLYSKDNQNGYLHLRSIGLQINS